MYRASVPQPNHQKGVSAITRHEGWTTQRPVDGARPAAGRSIDCSGLTQANCSSRSAAQEGGPPRADAHNDKGGATSVARDAAAQDNLECPGQVSPYGLWGGAGDYRGTLNLSHRRVAQTLKAGRGA